MADDVEQDDDRIRFEPGAVRQMSRSQALIRFAAGAAASLVAALVSELLDDPVRRKQMGEVGRERVAGALSWSRSQAALLAAYATVDPAPRGLGDAPRPATPAVSKR